MSSDLVWQIIGNNHAYLKKQRGVRKTFSTEAYNLKSINSPRLSGLANKTVVSVQPGADGKGIIFSTSHPVGARKLRQSTVKTTLKKNSRRSFQSIRGTLRGERVPRKIRSLAIRRASAILSSQRVKPADAKGAEKSKKK